MTHQAFIWKSSDILQITKRILKLIHVTLCSRIHPPHTHDVIETLDGPRKSTVSVITIPISSDLVFWINLVPPVIASRLFKIRPGLFLWLESLLPHNFFSRPESKRVVVSELYQGVEEVRCHDFYGVRQMETEYPHQTVISEMDWILIVIVAHGTIDFRKLAIWPPAIDKWVLTSCNLELGPMFLCSFLLPLKSHINFITAVFLLPFYMLHVWELVYLDFNSSTINFQDIWARWHNHTSWKWLISMSGVLMLSENGPRRRCGKWNC